MSPLRNLDRFRSTRTRIAKPTAPRQPPRPTSSSSAPADPRDWVRHCTTQKPLRILFVGHNPSDKSWQVCAPYAHPTNKFWTLLHQSSLLPSHLSNPSLHASLPKKTGLGFIDLFVTSGSDASRVRADAVKDDLWRPGFLQRLLQGTNQQPPEVIACVSKIVAQKLLKGWRGDYGYVGQAQEWNLTGLEQSAVWVLPSTSARAVLSHEARLAPFRDLGHVFENREPWESEEEQE